MGKRCCGNLKRKSGEGEGREIRVRFRVILY
jgi:hypothetical protein